MSTKISKRELFSKHALSAGIGVSAVALLPQRPSADTPFTSFPFTATGAPTPRTLPDRLADVINVKDYGAVGDGNNDDTQAIQAAFDAAFGPVGSPHGSDNPQLNKAVFFPSGIYKVSGDPALLVTGVMSGLIFGEGMFTSVIQSASANSRILRLNGWNFGCMRDIGVRATGQGACVALDYDWDNLVPCSSQNSLFMNCHFEHYKGGDEPTGIAVQLGKIAQTDTCTFLNCFINTGHGIGLITCGPNILNHTIIGGQFQGSLINIYVPNGSVSTIHGTFFSTQPTTNPAQWDIMIAGGGGDSCSIAGCRSESRNFLNITGASANVHVQGCLHAGGGDVSISDAHFVSAGGPVSMANCWTNIGDVFCSGTGSGSGQVEINGCVFGRHDALRLAGTAPQVNIKNTTLGDVRTGIGRYVLNQRYSQGIMRTYDIEAANVTSDRAFLYENFFDPVAKTHIENNVPTTIGGSVMFSVATSTVVTFPAVHNLGGGEAVAFSLVGAGSMPTSITANRTYFITKDALVGQSAFFRTCHLSDTLAHALAGTANIGVTVASGDPLHTWSVRKYAVGDMVKNISPSSGNPTGWVCTTAGYAAQDSLGGEVAEFKPLANLS